MVRSSTSRITALELVFIFAGGILPLARAEDLILVPRESTWRYFRGLEEASSPDTGLWRLADFDDSRWDSGPAPFGYGDPPYGTDLSLLEPPMLGNYTSVFLRHRFAEDEVSSLIEYHLRADYDDGFIAWINGVEVLRVNVAGERGSPVAFNGRASRSHESGSFETFVLPSPGDYVVSGPNLLAVQVFNLSIGNNDLKLDVELVDPFGPDITPPRAELVVPAPGSLVRRLTQVEVHFSEPVEGLDAADLLVNGGPAGRVTGAGAGPYVFAFEPPPPGTVRVAWAAGHGIRDLAPAANPFAGGEWTYRLDPSAPPPAVGISELLAQNRSGLRDEDGERSDWIEIHNRGAEAVNLAGWSLSDDPARPGQWTFPDLVLAPGEHLVVFASGKDRRLRGRELHTSFRLNAEGEYLGLFTSESPRAAATALDPFPEQRADHSYGFGSGGAAGYFVEPTPGAPNSELPPLAGFVADLAPGMPRGLYSEGILLALSTATPGAVIRYTLDGSEPGCDAGLLYSKPLRIEGTPARGAITLRAIACREGYLPSRTATFTYVFPEHVVRQPPNPAGFPPRWGAAPGVDYEMDPEITGSPGGAERVLEGLLSLPSLSIVAHVDDLFGTRGIYSNPLGEGVAWERTCSAELIHPGGDAGFQIDCGLRILGGASRQPERSPKHSFRLLFKGDHGPTKLRYRLFRDSPVAEFDTIVLRANYNNSWIHWDSGQRRRGMMLRDQWAKDTQLAMGQPGAYGTYVNLYLNGLYWGVYNVVERPSAPFAAAHLGGDKEEYDAISSAVAVDGNVAAWNAMMTLARGALNDPQRYQALGEHLDVANFIDYMLLNFYGANADWPNHNWYAARRRLPGEGFRFFSWDAERILENAGDSRLGASDSNTPGELQIRLQSSPEYRLAFADRAHRHLLGDGALAPAAAAARFLARADEVEKAASAESARWGDYRRDVHPSSNGPYELYRYETHWLPEKNRLLTTYFPQRSNVFLNQLRSAGLYPRVAAPVFSRHGGTIAPGFALEMSLAAGAAGTIYYTLDGSDPRVPWSGEVAPSAAAYAAPVLLSDYTSVKARTLEGTAWSALNEAIFRLPSSFEELFITEIMYNPPETQELEFLELFNAGATTLDLAGVYFSDGIELAFPDGAAIRPGGYLVIAASAAAFAERYPGVAVGGVYRGRLSNGGEKVTLKEPGGRTILSVEYGDGTFWPLAADGFGCSLVLADFAAGTDDPRAWRASAARGGSPGTADPPPARGGVWIHEVLASGRAGFEAGIELFNWSERDIDLGGWWLSDSREDAASLRKHRIAAGTVIRAGGYAVFSAAELAAAFALPAAGGGVYLSAPDLEGESGCYIIGAELGPSEPGVALGAHFTSTGADFTALSAPTLGGPNAAPRAAPVVINEIFYHPGAGGVEFLELHNRTAEDVPLHDAALGSGWRVSGISSAAGAGDFEFAPGTVIPARGYLLLVPVEPAGFRRDHAVPAGVPVVGPYGGALDNSGERLKLLRPARAESGTPLFVLDDHVRYNDKAPWPVTPDGGGPSLERVEAAAYGNEVRNWRASRLSGGTPGALNSVSSPPVEGGGQLPGDIDQDGRLTLTDAIRLLGHIFQQNPSALPCAGGTIEAAGNRDLLDADGDARVTITDAIHILRHLFQSGPAHAGGTSCRSFVGCPEACAE